MVVQHNLMAMNSNRMLGITTGSQAKSTEKLSSGYKINRAADDAAGLSISEKMRKQIRGLSQASLNAEDGISAVQTAEGALNEVQDMLQRMNELAVKASNGTMSENDRTYIQNEIDQLVTEIDRVSETTKFNETYLLKGDKEESTKPDVSGIINGEVKGSEYVEGKGNIYQNRIASGTTALAAGTEDTAIIQFIDADGNKQKVEVKFEVGNDNTATAKNLADAINKDETLSKVFKASSGANGRFELESLADGSETTSTKNALIKETATDKPIEFKSKKDIGTGGTQATTFKDTGTVTSATSGSYTVELKDEITIGTTSTNAQATLQAGDSITVDGKTYTYDPNLTNVANSQKDGVNAFGSLKQLQDLLGDDYEVSMTLTGTLTEKIYDKDGNLVATEKSDYVSQAVTVGTATHGTADIADVTIATPKNEAYTTPAGTDKSGIDKQYTDVKLNLNIIKKATAKQEVNALNFSLQVGADTTKENKISVDIESMSAKSLGIDGLKVDGKDSTNADRAVDTIAAAIQKVSTQRSALGAVQNRLEHTIANLDNVVENTTAAESQIRDTDMATEMVKYSNNNILAQAGQAMLAQANQANQGVLSLLG